MTKLIILRNKIQMPHQYLGDADNHSAKFPFYKPASKASTSENTSIDHGVVGEESLFYRREKRPCLNRETDHQLKSHNVHTADSKEESACSASEEHVEENEVPHVARSDHKCPVCDTNFKSMKSLSGHMRCHPERSWRGIKQPLTRMNSASSTIREIGGQKIDDQNDSAITMDRLPPNLLPPSAKWSVKRSRYMEPIHTQKVPSSLENMKNGERKVAYNLFMPSRMAPLEGERGRMKQDCEGPKANSKDSELKKSQIQEEENTSGTEPIHTLKVPDSLENMNKEEIKAAYNLFMLSRYTSVDRDQGRMKQDCEGSKANSKDSELEKLQIQEESASTIYEARIIESSETMDNNKSQMQIPCETKVEKMKKFQDMKVINGKGKSASSGSHICRTCKKSFFSPQALGGHMTSHKNDPMTATKVDAILEVYNAEDIRHASSDVAHSKPLQEIDDARSKGGMVHRCKTCNKTFPSRQALGGHQRCHWSGGGEASSTSVMMQENENRKDHQIHKFDLNVPAMTEAENDLNITLSLELKLRSSTI